jgi:hypothetical protein
MGELFAGMPTKTPPCRKLGIMFQAVLHLCWLNLRFPSTAISIAPLIEANPRLDPAEAEREFSWDDRLVRFHLIHLPYDRCCRGTAKPIQLKEAWRQFSDGSVYVRKAIVCIAVAIWQRLKGRITVTNRRTHEKLSTKIGELAIL